MCLAISLVTGPMIRGTAQIAGAAKEFYPDKPIVLGGWHPSLLPGQRLACQYVDLVVKGRGEPESCGRVASTSPDPGGVLVIDESTGLAWPASNESGTFDEGKLG